jgi:hypothetical protein
VPPPPVSDVELDHVADLTRLGRFQHKIALELDWDPSRVKRALKTMRIRVAVRSGEIWLDTGEKSPVEVAHEWLRLRATAYADG